MGTSDGSQKAARLSSEVDLKCGEVNESLTGQIPQEKGWILPLLTSSRSQLKALPQKCISAQLA